MKIAISAASHIGEKHINQDAMLVDCIALKEKSDVQLNLKLELFEENSILLAVCDGIGGAKGGEKAAAIAVDELNQNNEIINKIDKLNYSQTFNDIINSINSKIVNHEKIKNGSGTTLSLLKATNKEGELSIQIANIGDSPVYYFSKYDNQLYTLSMEHTVAYSKKLRGQQPTEADENSLVYFMGNKEMAASSQLHLLEEEIYLYKDDAIIICSDGVSKYLSKEELKLILTNYKTDTARKIIDSVLQSNRKPKLDDASVIIVTIE